MFWKALLSVTFTPTFYSFAQSSVYNNFGELVEYKPQPKFSTTTYLINGDVDNPHLSLIFLDIWIHRHVTLWMYYVQLFFGHICCVLHRWIFQVVNCKYISIPLYSKEIKTEDSSCLGYDTVIGQVFLDILKDYNAVILRDKQSNSFQNTRDCLPNYIVLNPRGTSAGRNSHIAKIKTCLTILE
jgi:hypothetical protein